MGERRVSSARERRVIPAQHIPQGARAMIRILIVDDHEYFRRGLRGVFTGRVDMEVAGEASTGQAALSLLRSEPFDIALVDLTLSDMSGIDVMLRAKAMR